MEASWSTITLVYVFTELRKVLECCSESGRDGLCVLVSTIKRYQTEKECQSLIIRDTMFTSRKEVLAGQATEPVNHNTK